MRYCPLCPTPCLKRGFTPVQVKRVTGHGASARHCPAFFSPKPCKGWMPGHQRGKGCVRSSSGWGGLRRAVAGAQGSILFLGREKRHQAPTYKQPFCPQHHAGTLTYTFVHIIFTTLHGKHCNSIFQRQKLNERGQFSGPKTQ